MIDMHKNLNTAEQFGSPTSQTRAAWLVRESSSSRRIDQLIPLKWLNIIDKIFK
jgi:hypothetical protein